MVCSGGVRGFGGFVSSVGSSPSGGSSVCSFAFLTFCFGFFIFSSGVFYSSSTCLRFCPFLLLLWLCLSWLFFGSFWSCVCFRLRSFGWHSRRCSFRRFASWPRSCCGPGVRSLRVSLYACIHCRSFPSGCGLSFCSSTSSSSLRGFLGYFCSSFLSYLSELVWEGRTALSDSDSRMASFLASGGSDFSFLPPRNSSYIARGELALGHAAPVNPSLLSLFEPQLKPSHHVGMSIREAAALEASVLSQSEALSHSMWVLSVLLAFMLLQNFAPEDSSPFNNLVTSLLKSLAHQASLTASHTAFLALKRWQFYLSHLPAYFSDISKRAMLSSCSMLQVLFRLVWYVSLVGRYSDVLDLAVPTVYGRHCLP